MILNKQNLYVVSRLLTDLYADPVMDQQAYPMEKMELNENELMFPTILRLILEENVDKRTKAFASIGLNYAAKREASIKQNLLEKRKVRDRYEFFVSRIGMFLIANIAWVGGRYLFRHRSLLKSGKGLLWDRMRDDFLYSSLTSSLLICGMLGSQWKSGLEYPVLIGSALSQYTLLSFGFSYTFLMPIVCYFCFLKMVKDFY